MSFARAKITRFNEKPNTRLIGAGGLRTKSQIPKIKSFSQTQSEPPKESPRPLSCSSQKRPRNGTGEGLNVGKPCNLTAVQENSINSDDYKDAIDDKTEMENVESLRDSTQISITVKESIASKSSNSGIPVPLKSSLSKQSTKTTPRLKPDQNAECKLIASPKRTLELQFLTKKKRLDQLRKDLEFKQKPVFELYESLMQIKKKLEESGKVVPLETIKLVDYENKPRRPPVVHSEITLSGGEIIKGQVDEITTEFLKNLKLELSTIPQTCIDLGSYFMQEREMVLKGLRNIKDPTVNIDELKQDKNRLQEMIDQTVVRQTNRVERVLSDISQVFEKTNMPMANQIIQDLERKVKLQEEEIINLTNELNQKEQQLKYLRENKEDISQKVIDENNGLKDRVKSLEAELQIKKKKLSDHGLNSKSYEQKIEILTKHAHEMEKAKKEADSKVNDINTHLRNLQSKIKCMEQKWREEKEELLKNHKGEHAILEKLTAERQALDTRVHLMNNILDEQKKSNEAEQAKLHKELLTAKEHIAAAAVEKQILEDQLSSMQQEVATLSLQQQQAVDVIKNTMDSEGNYITETESQLNTEVLALRVALRAAQDRIETYTTEKMRFIDSIEKLNCSGDAKESLGKALVQKEELITRLEHERKTLVKTLEDQKMAIDQMKVEIDNLQAGAIVNNLEHIPHDTQELQSMLEEGKAKLQKALTKSLDNEQKLIKYEHDINQQKKQLNDMENLLKVRDGLISMLKAKKDELVLENESLHRYSEEVRQLLFDTKEELKQKTDLLDEANVHIDDKNKLCYKLEKKIRELENTLSETNEKRYKLQDTVGCMEKELQSTRAHINQIADMQTRYDIGMPQLNTDIKLKQQGQARTVFQQYNKNNNNLQELDRRQKNIANSTVSNNLNRPSSPNRQYYSPTQTPSNSNRIVIRNINSNSISATKGVVMSDIKETYTYLPQNQIETSYIGDSSPTCLRKMYYYVPEDSVQNYANFMRKASQIAPNSMYRYCKLPSHKPLTQSLVNFETNVKIKNTKRNSSPILYSQKHAKIQTFSTPKLSSATQTDVQKVNSKLKPADGTIKFPLQSTMTSKNSFDDDATRIIFEPTKDQQLDPYKLCCDMLSTEQTDLNTVTHETPEIKMRERKEFISVVNKLSEFDNRKERENLALGKEFTPIIFGGVCRYKVMNSGSLMWCHPSKQMQLNNMLITSDIKAHLPVRMENIPDKNKKVLNNNRNPNSSEIPS